MLYGNEFDSRVTVPVPAARAGSVSQIGGTADGPKLSVYNKICPVVAEAKVTRNGVCPICNGASETSSYPCMECINVMHDDRHEHHGAIADPAVTGILVERDLLFSPLHFNASHRQSVLSSKVGDCSGHNENHKNKSSIHSQACRTVVFPVSLTYSPAAAMPEAVEFKQPVTFSSKLSSAQHFGEGLGRHSSAKSLEHSQEIGLISGNTCNIPPQRRQGRLKLKKPEVQPTGGMEPEALPAGRSGA